MIGSPEIITRCELGLTLDFLYFFKAVLQMQFNSRSKYSNAPLKWVDSDEDPEGNEGGTGNV